MFTAYVLCSLRLFELGIEGQTILKFQKNVKDVKLKFSLILGQFNLALNLLTARSSSGKTRKEKASFLKQQPYQLYFSILNCLLNACILPRQITCTDCTWIALRRLPLSKRDSNFSGLAVSSGDDLSPSDTLKNKTETYIYTEKLKEHNYGISTKWY